MKRVILDTNIYGEIIEKKDHEFIIKNLYADKLTIYGLDLIRKELRSTSKNKTIQIENKSKKLRILLLELYDLIVRNRVIYFSPYVEKLANDYILTYKELGGGYSEEEVFNDFLIVACASLNHIDIVYSQDNKTMVSDKAKKSYNIVNKIIGLRIPEFKSYEVFKKDVTN